jgi:hypothetical protein
MNAIISSARISAGPTQFMFPLLEKEAAREFQSNPIRIIPSIVSNWHFYPRMQRRFSTSSVIGVHKF